MLKKVNSAPRICWAFFCAAALLGAARAQADAVLPRPGFLQAQPASFELNWTPLRLPTGERIALLGASYMVAMNDDWGVGPSFYGAAKGDFGGIFTVGFTAQRRWRISDNMHAAAGLYAGAGGGLSTDQVRFGGGLMLRPELSLRAELSSHWYAGLALAHTRFPSGNVSGSSLGFVLGYTDAFLSYAPADAGMPAHADRRTGMGFDEIAPNLGVYQPRAGSRRRSGAAATRIGYAGASMRQYVSEGAWWGGEAAGAAQGGANGYMEVLAALGQDYAMGSPNLRLGWSVAMGLGGGGDVDTGNGWLLKVGPSLRWKTPWGPSLSIDAGLADAPSGHFKSNYARFSLSLPLDQAIGSYGQSNDAAGVVRGQTISASLQHLAKVRFKDGREESLGHIAILMRRELGPHLYGVAQAGSAAFGSAGAYSFGLFGMGLQTRPLSLQGVRVGAEMMVGAAGGGGVDVSGGAVMQTEAWAEWHFGSADRLSLRTGLGQWRSLRGQTQSSPLVNVSLGYAFGALQR